ncbi:MAG: hypothetical protein QM731_02270 [Chitinophagaceae bacterium]
MKQFFKILYAIALLLIVIFANSCNKLVDYLRDHPDAEVPGCSIKKLIVYTNTNGIPDSRTADFTYNSYGDPVKITVSSPGTGNPNREFRYNAKHQLTDYIGAYTNGSFEYWSTYVYSGDRIIRDTTFIFGTLGTRPTGYYTYRVSDYEYDSNNRIIAVYGIGGGTYAYGADGNLVTGDTYDSQVNFRRTNKIWMFLDRNYSVNNAKPGSSYNYNHLPLTIQAACYTTPGGCEGVFDSFLTFNYDKAVITYSCK